MQRSCVELFYALGILRFRYVDLCGSCYAFMLSVYVVYVVYHFLCHDATYLHATGLDPVPIDGFGVDDDLFYVTLVVLIFARTEWDVHVYVRLAIRYSRVSSLNLADSSSNLSMSSHLHSCTRPGAWRI
ncbi:uncharacterized protein EDB91DRAFT_1150831 [Suillus paluster]|uniref:uncharacterized protein n=1 Tax=Suillus paluster TaxID=48578 RepID=UPI001B883FF2|nr:uncharacterized protein EDB91DRAFT_1150831 [Suillus paluster]KAG1732888.1 hypothetical protein EDB91DRAFT_1150831 [Suillus paluster]